jgi:NADH-quinone oxidoreductase subunit M
MLKQIPKLGWILGFCAMASLGLPGLAGFWGEFPALVSAWNPAKVLIADGQHGLFKALTIVGALGTVLAAAYLLWLYQRTAFGEPTAEFSGSGAHSLSAAANHHDDHGSDIHDVTTYEWIAWTPLLIAIVVFGVYPQLMFKVMDPAVTNLLRAFGK